MLQSQFWAGVKNIPTAIAIVQARLGSTRLPNKMLLDLGGKPVIQHVIDRLRKCKSLHHIVVASPDNELVDLAQYQNGVWGYLDTGDVNNVLARYVKAASWSGAQLVVRISGDCPLIDYRLVDEYVMEYVKSRVDIVSNVFRRSFPKGMDVEVLHVNTLKRIYHLTDNPLYREHVTLFIYENPSLFVVKSMTDKGRDHSFINVSIDTKTDLDRTARILSKLKEDYSCSDVIRAYEELEVERAEKVQTPN